jgi:hypothetical protein
LSNAERSEPRRNAGSPPFLTSARGSANGTRHTATESAHPTLLGRRSTSDIHFWLTVFWLVPGTILWIVVRDYLWFVGFMSLYAIWVTHLAGWSAETPAEVEEEPPAER